MWGEGVSCLLVVYTYIPMGIEGHPHGGHTHTWLMTGGSLHLETSPQPNFDMGMEGGGGVAAIFPVYTVFGG